MALTGCMSSNEAQATLLPQLKNRAAQKRLREVIFEFSHSLGRKGMKTASQVDGWLRPESRTKSRVDSDC